MNIARILLAQQHSVIIGTKRVCGRRTHLFLPPDGIRALRASTATTRKSTAADLTSFRGHFDHDRTRRKVAGKRTTAVASALFFFKFSHTN